MLPPGKTLCRHTIDFNCFRIIITFHINYINNLSNNLSDRSNNVCQEARKPWAHLWLLIPSWPKWFSPADQDQLIPFFCRCGKVDPHFHLFQTLLLQRTSEISRRNIHKLLLAQSAATSSYLQYIYEFEIFLAGVKFQDQSVMQRIRLENFQRTCPVAGEWSPLFSPWLLISEKPSGEDSSLFHATLPKRRPCC